MNEQLKIILSDLHLGAGPYPIIGPLEDFDQDEPFSDFLESLVRESEESQAPIELVFAGDTFEFLQVPDLERPEDYDPTQVYPVAYYAATSELSSCHKMNLIVAGHPLVFGALAAFMHEGPPQRTVTIIKGNHDINLHWLGVQRVLREALRADGSSSHLLSFVERRISRDGLYVEHGNQYAEQINRFPDFEEPHDPDRIGELYQPAGSRFVFKFFNEMERRHYWLDGIKPITALIWYILSLDTALAIKTLLAFLAQVPDLIWGSLPFARVALAADAERQKLLQALGEGGSLASGDLSQPQDIAERLERVSPLYGLPDTELPTQGAPAASGLARGRKEEDDQTLALFDAAHRKHVQEGVQIVVFGHTHQPGMFTFDDGAVYINTGTWTWQRNFGSNLDAWKEFLRHPEQYTGDRHLTFAQIAYPDGGAPVASLRTLDASSPQKPLWQRLCDWFKSFWGSPNHD